MFAIHEVIKKWLVFHNRFQLEELSHLNKFSLGTKWLAITAQNKAPQSIRVPS